MHGKMELIMSEPSLFPPSYMEAVPTELEQFAEALQEAKRVFIAQVISDIQYSNATIDDVTPDTVKLYLSLKRLNGVTEQEVSEIIEDTKAEVRKEFKQEPKTCSNCLDGEGRYCNEKTEPINPKGTCDNWKGDD